MPDQDRCYGFMRICTLCFAVDKDSDGFFEFLELSEQSGLLCFVRKLQTAFYVLQYKLIAILFTKLWKFCQSGLRGGVQYLRQTLCLMLTAGYVGPDQIDIARTGRVIREQLHL